MTNSPVDLRALLEAARCPDENCDGDGNTWTVETTSACCNRAEYGCGGDGCTGPIAEQIQVQQQCEWCDKRKSALLSLTQPQPMSLSAGMLGHTESLTQPQVVPSDWLNRRAYVEEEMLECARGKQSMPDGAKLKEWAARLGIPTEYQHPATSISKPSTEYARRVRDYLALRSSAFITWLATFPYKGDQFIENLLGCAYKAAEKSAADLLEEGLRREAEANETARLYSELIYQVANKWPNETRHETAKRYIQNAENRSAKPSAGQTP